MRVFLCSKSGVMALAIYTTGRVGDLPVCGKASTEVRDRTLARIGPQCARHGR